MIMIKKTSILIGSFLLFSCNELSQSIKDTLNPDTEKVILQSKTEPLKPVESIAKSVKSLQVAENSLRNLPQLEGQEIFVYRSAHFYEDGRIILNIQDPVDPGLVDRYTYVQKWEVAGYRARANYEIRPIGRQYNFIK